MRLFLNACRTDFSGIGAAETAADHVTSASNNELELECVEVCENDPKAMGVLKANVSAEVFNDDILEMFTEDVQAKVKEMDASTAKGTFAQFKKLFAIAGPNPKSKSKKAKRSLVNVAGSPCIHYSLANHKRQGKHGKGNLDEEGWTHAYMYIYIYIHVPSCIYIYSCMSRRVFRICV